jgi:predicted TIM-barrel fold metal-dependent hydrolase
MAGATAAAATAAGLGLAPASAASAGPGARPAGGRIDTHHHAVPDAVREWAIARGLLPPVGGPSWAYWTEQDALRVMADNQIAAAVVSAPVPSIAFADRSLAEEGVRVCNESFAALVAAYPGRFGFFANVAPLHIELALQQVAHAFDDLGADGVILMASAGGKYVGDAAFEPLFAALNRRRAVVLIHPDGLPDTELELPGVSNSLADFLLDTTRAALNLIVSGTLERYPDVTVILSHAGGFLPYLAGRAESQGRQHEFVHPDVFRRALRRFYYDTALPASPYATPTLLKAAGPSHILYGTDFAARPATEVGVITRDLDNDSALDARTRHAVNRGNAVRLFPRLAARLGR